MRVPRHLVVAALDALAIGDQAEAVEVLLEALEAPETSRRRDVVGPPPCSVCGVRTWREERHIFSAHHPPTEQRRAA